MDEIRWQRVKEVFAAALERDAGSRSAFLDAECAGDTELRAELDSLICAHETTDDFIAKPAAHRALGITSDAEPRSWIGRRVGDYRLVEEVGRGGMSEVYKGVRDDDEYRKDVAIKVLRKGYDTKSLLRRFRAEIQILASLDHPNIARLLDAGSTEEGLPWLAMDYIQGRPIDEYASFMKLNLRDRLELFRALCGAVQYVHQHLMVHGDLKCSNVLVSEQGAVKLLDFGIARILNPKPGVVPEAKLTSLIALTPEYASPEQVRGGAITTASDVYSLGVLLYRLVTGVLPHRLRGDFSFELALQILEREATPPSIAVREHVAKSPAPSEFEGFARQLHGDLDNIVLMALEKDPTKRYPSVEAFEADIRRHLQGFPVEARAAGPAYRLMKFAGRHKAGIVAITMLIAALTGGIVSTTWQARVALGERERAERHFNEVRKLANVFMFDLHSAIADLPGSTPARQMLVENSLQYLAALSAESGSNEPSLQRELASAYEKVADIQGGYRMANLGDPAGAIVSYRKALAIRQTLEKAGPPDRELRRELLRNYGKLGETLTGEGENKEALTIIRQAMRLAQELAAAPDATVADRRNLGSALGSLGWQLTHLNQVGDGIFFMRQSAAIFESLLESDPNNLALARMLGASYDRIGSSLLDYTDQSAEALQIYSREYDLARQMTTLDTHNTALAKQMGYSLLGMGTALERLKRPREALQKQVDATRVLRATLDADPRNDVGRYDAAVALVAAGGTDIVLGDLGTAEKRLTDAVGILASSSGITQAALSDSKVLLALAHFELGQVNARQAASPASTRDQRERYCREAQRWFELSRPVLAAAHAASGQWETLSRGKTDEMTRELQVCTPALTARELSVVP